MLGLLRTYHHRASSATVSATTKQRSVQLPLPGLPRQRLRLAVVGATAGTTNLASTDVASNGLKHGLAHSECRAGAAASVQSLAQDVKCRLGKAVATSRGHSPRTGQFPGPSHHHMPTFEVTSERVGYQRYLSVFDRKVKVVCEHTGKVQEVDYDVVGHPRCNFRSVTVLPFHPAHNGTEPQFTLIREYCQGPDAVCYNVPSGGFDPKKHDSLTQCALAELSEEALLHGGTLVQLTPPDHPGFYEVKWCRNRFTPFLVIDPEADPDPGDRDEEEHIQVVRVSLSQLERLVADGELMLPSMMTVRMAVDHLRQQGLLPQL